MNTSLVADIPLVPAPGMHTSLPVARNNIGEIAADGDAFTILRDAAALARDPVAVPIRARPQAVSKVVA